MAWVEGKSTDLMVYVLTPEFSSHRHRDRTFPQKLWQGCAKSTIWILISIILALALGQLH